MEKHQDNKLDGDIAIQSDVPFEPDIVIPARLHEFLIRANGDEVIEVRASDNHVELLCVTDDGQRHTIKDRHVTWRLSGRLQWGVTGRVAETTVKKFAEVLDLDLDDGDNASAMTYEEAIDFLRSCPYAIESGALDALYEEWERNNFEPDEDDTRREALDAQARLAGHC